MKCLVALDFDHTIVDENSDLYIRKLAPGGVIPSEISSLYSNKGWTDYMGAIFRYLHENKTSKEDILQCLREIPLVQGMKQLFEYLSTELFDVIIISDANSIFIENIMEYVNLAATVNSIYTNPAYFTEDGCLKVSYYHEQDWCDLSTVNLCKGHILESHIEQELKCNGITYDLVAYVGDGSNDLCPSLKLKQERDLVFPRVGYSLVSKLENPETKKDLTARVVPWSSGLEILQCLQDSVKTLQSTS